MRNSFSLCTIVREHIVLAISVLVAFATSFIVVPDEAYLTYIDWQTLGCLFSVLAVANAFRLQGAFERVAQCALKRVRAPHAIAGVLIITTALLSMIATNDMALIVMLPLTAVICVRARWYALIPVVYVLQSLAANLCGMIVPFGNPQNIYLYSYYSIALIDFLKTMIIPFVLSVVLIAISFVVLVRRTPIEASTPKSIETSPLDHARLVTYTVLLLLTLLAVFRIIPVVICVVVIVAVLLVVERRALKAVDYPLLLTFACFFIFSGNMARIPALNDWLTSLMGYNALVASAGLSQIISNVPAAVLLSHFTTNWEALLVGVNVGGAGTLVGSLASLITLQHFRGLRRIFPQLCDNEQLSLKRFLGLFTILNFAILVVLLISLMGIVIFYA